MAPQGPHLAFEPIPALAEQIRQSFPHVDCRQLALGARPETAEFCYFRKLDGWSGLKRSPEISDERGAPEFISVDVSTLDLQAGDLNPRVIRIDVEGAELAVPRRWPVATVGHKTDGHLRACCVSLGTVRSAVTDALGSARGAGLRDLLGGWTRPVLPDAVCRQQDKRQLAREGRALVVGATIGTQGRPQRGGVSPSALTSQGGVTPSRPESRSPSSVKCSRSRASVAGLGWAFAFTSLGGLRRFQRAVRTASRSWRRFRRLRRSAGSDRQMPRAAWLLRSSRRTPCGLSGEVGPIQDDGLVQEKPRSARPTL